MYEYRLHQAALFLINALLVWNGMEFNFFFTQGLRYDRMINLSSGNELVGSFIRRRNVRLLYFSARKCRLAPSWVHIVIISELFMLKTNIFDS